MSCLNTGHIMRFYSCLYLPQYSGSLALADPGMVNTYSLTESDFLLNQHLKNGVSNSMIRDESVLEVHCVINRLTWILMAVSQARFSPLQVTVPKANEYRKRSSGTLWFPGGWVFYYWILKIKIPGNNGGQYRHKNGKWIFDKWISPFLR